MNACQEELSKKPQHEMGPLKATVGGQ